jgi:DNA helicase-2/ATP-dependent DNA helicase PcrA
VQEDHSGRCKPDGESYSASSAETIERVFPQADIVKLYRSYRSTLEITAFALRITP